MSTLIKSSSPRIQIREKDNLSGSYPRNVYLGNFDKRIYTQIIPSKSFVDSNHISNTKNVPYDDLRTLSFSDHTVYYPTLLPTGSQFITPDLTSSISVTSSLVAGVTDKFTTFSTFTSSFRNKRFTFFDESKLYEQNQTSSFYLTGSSNKDVGLGFSSRLASKTRLNFQFFNNSDFTINADSASCNAFKWDVGWQNVTAIGPKPVPSFEGNVQMFGPRGLFTISGTYYDNFESRVPIDFFAFDPTTDFDWPEHQLAGNPAESLNIILSSEYKDTFLSSSKASLFDSVPSFSYKLNINRPFLIERVVLEVPLKCGPGWSFDQTAVTASLDGGDEVLSQSFGGPCITFALLRNDVYLQEIICSGTIIPVNDNKMLWHVDNFFNIATPKGFLALSEGPSVIIDPNSSGFFTGTVVLEMTPSTTSGYLASKQDTLDTIYFNSIAPPGRSHVGPGTKSGRSIFGKEQNSLTNSDKTNFKTFLVPFTGSTDFVSYIDNYRHQYSPYLLMPNDKLVLVCCKHHSCIVNPVSGGLSNATQQVSMSHDVKIGQGLMNLTIYGSYIQNSKEYHDPLSQQLTSDSLFQDINDGPILDQYDVEFVRNFSGSYLDDVVTGSMVDGTRGLEGSAIGDGFNRSKTNGILQRSLSGSSLLRFYQANDKENQLYDTLIPPIREILDADGAKIGHDSTGNQINFRTFFSHSAFIIPSEEIGFDNADDNWLMAAPFESRYAEIRRARTPGTELLSAEFVNNSTNVYRNFEPDQRLNIQLWVSDITGTVNNIVLNSSQFIAALTDLNIRKIFYGTTNQAVSGKYTLRTMPDLQGFVTTDKFTTVLVRGAKRGLINCLEQYPKSLFRRDRFTGMRSDLVEQRKDYKTINSNNQIGTSPVNISFISGSENAVQSLNTSFEYTSSLWFEDGLVRH